MKAPVDVAQRIVEMVGGRAEAQASMVAGEAALTRFANSFIHQNVAEATAAVTVRVALEGRVARGTDTRTDDVGLAALAERTLEAARLSPADPEWPGLAPAAPLPAIDNYDEATAAASPELRAEVVRDFIAAAGGTDAAGFCDTEALVVGYANSLGQRGTTRRTRATIDGIHRVGTVAGSGHQTSWRLGDLDGAAAGALAATRFGMAADPFDLKPGEYEVVLAPECLATMVIFLGLYGFNGKAFTEGQSFLEIGRQQFDEAIDIWDDPGGPGAVGLAFDGEGTPKGRLDLVRAGMSLAATHDRKTAGRVGGASTGHSLPGLEEWGAVPSDLVIAGGSRTEAEMIAAVERGLYVATFNYVRVLDPKTMVATGLTRNGTFMIENGRITGAVTNLRFTQSFVAALGPERVLDLGAEVRYADSEIGPGLVRAPAARLAAWNFTGGAGG
jgi:predicted Zn-dependent protease